MRRTTKGFFAGLNCETKRCKVFNSFIFRGKQKQIAFSPESYCSSRNVLLITLVHLLGVRREIARQSHPLRLFLCSFVVCGVASFGYLRHQIKSISTQLESEATTNITFMMIEFDLCGVSNLKNPFLLLLFISGWLPRQAREFRLGIAGSRSWNCIISL